MPKIPQALTTLTIENLKPKKSVYTKPDGEGLFIRVAPSGLKSWVSRYTGSDGKRGLVVIGKYPVMTLAEARLKNEEVRAKAEVNKDAIISYREEKKLARLQKTKEELEEEQRRKEVQKRCFTVVSESWLEEYKLNVSDGTYYKAVRIVRKSLQASLGAMDISTLGRFHVEPILLELGAVAPSQARKAIQYVRQIIDYAIDKRLRDEFTEINFNKVIKKLPQGGHLPAITNDRDLVELLEAIDSYDGFYVKNALKLCLWTGHRPYIISTARWKEIDLNEGVWLVSGYETEKEKNSGRLKRRMKTGKSHIVSLPRQAVEMLKELYNLSGGGEYVFPNQSARASTSHIARDALSKALRVMGFSGKHCTHGFRALMRTIAREEIDADADVLEAQLAHSKRDANKGAYDRTTFTKKRVSTMQAWADYLDALRQKNKEPLKLVS